jgi:Domain of unknown function (DUF1877)
MTARGRHFALTSHDEARILALAGRDEIVMFITDDIEARYEEPWYCDTDKSWDAMHRAFDNSQLTYEFASALHGIIIGGRLSMREDFLISYKSTNQVQSIATAIGKVTKIEFRKRYDAIDETAYGYPKSDLDFDYTWDNLTDLVQFYALAAGEKRAVVFTVGL